MSLNKKLWTIVFSTRAKRNLLRRTRQERLLMPLSRKINVFYVPPLLLIPGQRLNRATMDQCSIAGGTATVYPKGFMHSNILIKLLNHFISNVPGHVKRPIVLVYNEYGSHYSTDMVEKATELIIILVFLPSNSTNLIQPLYVLVFKPFNTELKHQMEKLMIKNDCTSFTKKYAIAIASIGFEKGIINNT